MEHVTVRVGVFSHSGSNFPGFQCYFFGFRDDPMDGLAVLTNSLIGFAACIRPIVSAMFYLQKWPLFETLLFDFAKAGLTPYPAIEGAETDDGWRQWVGAWEGDWKLLDDGGPRLAYQTCDPITIRPAAISTAVDEHVFVVEGLKLTVHLSVSDGEQSLELWQVDVQKLQRVDGKGNNA